MEKPFVGDPGDSRLLQNNNNIKKKKKKQKYPQGRKLPYTALQMLEISFLITGGS